MPADQGAIKGGGELNGHHKEAHLLLQLHSLLSQKVQRLQQILRGRSIRSADGVTHRQGTPGRQRALRGPIVNQRATAASFQLRTRLAAVPPPGWHSCQTDLLPPAPAACWLQRGTGGAGRASPLESAAGQGSAELNQK